MQPARVELRFIYTGDQLREMTLALYDIYAVTTEIEPARHAAAKVLATLHSPFGERRVDA